MYRIKYSAHTCRADRFDWVFLLRLLLYINNITALIYNDTTTHHIHCDTIPCNRLNYSLFYDFIQFNLNERHINEIARNSDQSKQSVSVTSLLPIALKSLYFWWMTTLMCYCLQCLNYRGRAGIIHNGKVSLSFCFRNQIRIVGFPCKSPIFQWNFSGWTLRWLCRPCVVGVCFFHLVLMPTTHNFEPFVFASLHSNGECDYLGYMNRNNSPNTNFRTHLDTQVLNAFFAEFNCPGRKKNGHDIIV